MIYHTFSSQYCSWKSIDRLFNFICFSKIFLSTVIVCSSGDILNCIALRNNKEIIGHTAFIKQEFSINNNVYYGGLTVGSAVKNNHVGIFPSMYEYLEKSFANEFDFLYGYPNQKW